MRRQVAELGITVADERLGPLIAEHEQHLRRADRLRLLLRPEDEPGFLDLRAWLSDDRTRTAVVF